VKAVYKDWTHYKGKNCDTWYEPESFWHKHWKKNFGFIDYLNELAASISLIQIIYENTIKEK
jgi:hypothetical protein